MFQIGCDKGILQQQSSNASQTFGDNIRQQVPQMAQWQSVGIIIVAVLTSCAFMGLSVMGHLTGLRFAAVAARTASPLVTPTNSK